MVGLSTLFHHTVYEDPLAARDDIRSTSLRGVLTIDVANGLILFLAVLSLLDSNRLLSLLVYRATAHDLC